MRAAAIMFTSVSSLMAGSALAGGEFMPRFDGEGIPGAPEFVNVGGEEVSPPSAYIVSGEEAAEDEYLNVVFLEMEGAAGESTCTGSLIHRNWILTAAHCIDDETISRVFVNFGDRRGNFFKTVEADDWFHHHRWKGEDVGFEGDVALIHLAEPVDDIFPMALNKQEVTNDWRGIDLTFIGFGITEWQGGGSGIKRFVAVPITNVPLNNYEIIVYDGQHSTCQGDSGGPGILFSGGAYTQVSVTSYGQECGDGISGVMRVDTYLSWIRDNMAPDEPTTSPTAPPTYRCSHEQEPGSSETIAIGKTPLDLKCIVDFYAPEAVTEVKWTWGDGGTLTKQAGDATLLQGDHTYEETGNFNVKMCVDYEIDGRAGEHCTDRTAYVRACGVPDVAFTYEAKDTRTLQLLNFTDISGYGCIFNSQWQIYEGDSASGTPLETLEAWAPEYTFPTSGKYHLVLNVGGIGGTGAAELTINVAKATRGTGGCNDVGGAGGFAVALAGLALLRRRR